MKVAIVGAGAAGCFCAIELKRRMSSASVEVFEAGTKALAKVAITGGGRCNLTNSFEGISSLSAAYPRGDKLMKRLFRTFDQKSTWQWFENEGVKLVLQEDHCVFRRRRTRWKSLTPCRQGCDRQELLFIQSVKLREYSHVLKVVTSSRSQSLPKRRKCLNTLQT